MLKRENDLRLCAATQRRFKAVNSRPDGWLKVVEELQRQVAQEFKLPEAMGLYYLRHAETFLPWEEIKELSLYRKFNRCRDGSLQVGDRPPSVTLNRSGDLKPIELRSRLDPKRPTVLLAGSYT